MAASRQPIGRSSASAFSIIGTRYGSLMGNASFLRRARLFFFRYCPSSSRYRLLSGCFPAGPSAALQPVGWLTRLLGKGRVLLLVDGIDEVPHDKRQDVRTWLEALLAQHDDTAVVVTSRPSAVPDSWLTGSKFTGFSVVPMRRQDVGAFVDRWFASLQEAGDWSGYRNYAERWRRRLRAEPDSSSPAAKMAANPRLCSLICALWLENQGSLPTDPLSLHAAALRLLGKSATFNAESPLRRVPGWTSTHRRLSSCPSRSG
jgi:hypothetical protein